MKKTLNDKSRPKFTIIEGGIKIPPVKEELRASLKNSCFEIKATNTRLMGVVGLKLTYNMVGHRFTQLFILDYEEYGIAEYIGLFTDSIDEIESNASAMFGALGGSWVELSSEEAWALIARAEKVSEKYGSELPEQYIQFKDAISGADEDTKLYKTALSAVCVSPSNDEELINYFIMRSCGKDDEAAEILCNDNFLDKSTSQNIFRYLNKLKLGSPSTLFKNSVKKSNQNKFICESLIEENGEFSILVSEISVMNNLISSAVVISIMRITPWEASMQLRQSDYVLTAGCDYTQAEFAKLINTAFNTVNAHSHESGMLYMIYKDNNNHVKSADYRLDADLLASIYFIDEKEIIISSPNSKSTDEVFQNLILSNHFLQIEKLSEIERFKFDDKVMGPFIESGLNDFKEFIEFYNGTN